MDTRDTRIRAPAGIVSEIKTFMRPVQPQRWDRYENTDSKSTFYYISGRGRQRISQFLLQSPQILTRRSVASFHSSAYRVLQFLNFCPWTILPFCWDIFRCVFVGKCREVNCWRSWKMFVPFDCIESVWMTSYCGGEQRLHHSAFTSFVLGI